MKNVRIRFCGVWGSYPPRAARAAASIKQELGIEAELIEGGRGEFTVWVDDKLVAEKGWIRFPSDEKIVESVRQALNEQ